MYEFYYKASDIIFVVKGKSTIFESSSQLPKPSDDTQLQVYSTVSDNLGAEALSSILVTINSKPDFNVTEYYLGNKLSEQDVGNNFQVPLINVVATTLNVINCSLTSPSFCHGLNRGICGSGSISEVQENRCGRCLAGFSSDVILGNTPCKNISSTVVIGKNGSSCSTDSDCDYNNCRDNICITPIRRCPNDCSGRGKCNYYSRAGSLLPSACLESDTCNVRCVCDKVSEVEVAVIP